MGTGQESEKGETYCKTFVVWMGRHDRGGRLNSHLVLPLPPPLSPFPELKTVDLTCGTCFAVGSPNVRGRFFHFASCAVFTVFPISFTGAAI
jgi:hypothetical protein